MSGHRFISGEYLPFCNKISHNIELVNDWTVVLLLFRSWLIIPCVHPSVINTKLELQTQDWGPAAAVAMKLRYCLLLLAWGLVSMVVSAAPQVLSGLTGNHHSVPTNNFKMLCPQAAAKLTGETGESHFQGKLSFQSVDEEKRIYYRNVNQSPFIYSITNANTCGWWTCVCRNWCWWRPGLGHPQH